MRQRKVFLKGLLSLFLLFYYFPVLALAFDEPIYMAQHLLFDRGYNPGPLDGVFGGATGSALRRFQEDNSLPITGTLDDRTSDVLGADRNIVKTWMMPSLGGIQKTMAHDESEIVVVTDKDSKTASAATQYFDEGYGLFQHGLPDLALKFFKQAVAEDPLYLDALFYSFRCYQKLDRSGKALQTLERLRDALVDPGSLNRERLRYVRTASNTYNQTPMQFAAIEKVKMLEIIGADLFRRERYRLAKQYDLESMRLLERVRRAPSPDKNRKLAKDYFAAGHYHHAIDFFNELKQGDRFSVDDYAVFGMCLVRIGAIGEEFIPYKWMMQNAPDNIFINVGSGWYYSNQNIESEQVKGQKYLQRSIALLEKSRKHTPLSGDSKNWGQSKLLARIGV